MPDYSELIQQGIQGAPTPSLAGVFAAETKIGIQETIQIDATADALTIDLEEAVNPGAAKLEKKLESLKDKKEIFKKSELDRLEQRVVALSELEEAADRFSKNSFLDQNGKPELKRESLIALAKTIKDAKTKEEVLELVHLSYPDPSLANEALKFLEEVCFGELKKIVQEAHQDHEAKFGREIRAGQNIAEEVAKYAAQGVGVPTQLRDLYRDLISEQKEPVVVFMDFADRFKDYKQLRKVLAFLFHSLGAELKPDIELKAQRPSIEPAKLHALLTEIKSLQAVLGVYKFFQGRAKLISFLFDQEGLKKPPQLTFEALAKQFVVLLQERYPSEEKVLAVTGRLGLMEAAPAA